MVCPIVVCMFEPVIRDETGRAVDPRDVPRSRGISLFCASQLDRFTSVLSANVEALDPENQLELGAELSSCVSTMEWMKCRVASSVAHKDAKEALATAATSSGRGGPVMRQLGGPGTPKVSEFLLPEVALAFGCSEREATAYVGVGLDLRFRLRCTNAEFGGGRISYAAAKAIAEETRALPPETAEQLDAILAEAALSRTPARLRLLARRRAAAADPAATAKRHRHAVANRGAAMFSLGDGMGAFSLTTTLETAAVVADHVDAWAYKLRAQLPSVPLDAHRADAAARLLLGQHPLTGTSFLANTSAGDTPAADSPSCDSVSGVGLDGWLPARTELRVTMTADTLLGLDDATCELDGFGPLTAAQARQLALRSASSTLRRVFTDPADDSVLFLDARRYRFTGDQVACIATLHPYSTFPGATTRAAKCDIDHVQEYRVAPDRSAAPDVSIAPDCSGSPFIGANRHAGSSDRCSASGDPPWTVVTNAQPLGRRHHRLKTHGGWRVRNDPDDPHTFHWTSPRGRSYTTSDTDGV